MTNTKKKKKGWNITSEKPLDKLYPELKIHNDDSEYTSVNISGSLTCSLTPMCIARAYTDENGDATDLSGYSIGFSEISLNNGTDDYEYTFSTRRHNAFYSVNVVAVISEIPSNDNYRAASHIVHTMTNTGFKIRFYNKIGTFWASDHMVTVFE